MRISLVGPMLGAWTALTACSDPGLAITVGYDEPGLREQLGSLTLAVIELPPHPDGSPVACDEVRYGRISRDQLDGGRRASASAMSGQAGLNGVPRLGEKLIVLEGRDRGGDRIAGGCVALGDIEEDTTVEITAEVVPRVRLVGARGVVRDPSDPLANVELVLYRPWKDGDGVVGLGGRKVEVDLRDRAADRVSITTATSCGGAGPSCPNDQTTGRAALPLGDLKASLSPAILPGPIEVSLRAPWLEEPLVGRAWEPLPLVPGTDQYLAPVGLQRTANQAAPSWAIVRDNGLRAAAIYVSGGDLRAYRIVLFETRGAELTLVRRDLVANEPIYSLVAWNGGFWTRAASGWRRLNFATATLEPGVGGAGEAATEMIAIEKCDASGPEGLLIRAGDRPYVAYDAPAVPHVGALDPLATLTTAVNLIDPGRLMSTVCLSYPTGGVRRTAVVRGEAHDVMPGDPVVSTYLIPAGAATRLPSPVASGFLGYQHGTWRLAGAALDVTGPRLVSYSLTGEQLLGGEDGRLEGELTTLPTSTSVVDLDQDGELDVVATSHEIVGETRIQVTYVGNDERAPLTGLSPPFRGVAPLVAIDRFELSGHWIATIATSDKVSMFDLGTR